MEPELIADYACVTGEGPLWHPTERRLYWADIPQGRLFRYDPASGAHEQIYEGDVIGGFTIQADGALLLFMARGAVRIWRDGALTTLLDSIPGEEETRFNDVIAAPGGRVFCGTMAIPGRRGRLYRLDLDLTLTTVVEDVGISNGMGFTADRATMYYTDSAAGEIYRYHYDEQSGAMTNRRVIVRVPNTEGLPDGMTVDADGNIWSARWDGSCLVQYAPDGTEMQRITFPAKKVSSVVFGGPDYREMYVTTAGGNDKVTNGPGAGALFRLRLGIQGVPEYASQIGLGA
jgi:sugar lactone lactonase YvrE